MDELQLSDASNKIVAQVLAVTASLNDQLDEVLVAKFNIPINSGVHNRTWLEIAYFGTYTLLQRAQKSYSADDYVNISREVHKGLIHMILTVVFFDEKDEATKASLEAHVSAGLAQSLESYKEHVGDTSLVLRDLIRDIFNASEDSKIKFVDGDWITKLKINIAFALGNSEFQAKHKDEQLLNGDFLLPVVHAIATRFRTLDQKEFIESEI